MVEILCLAGSFIALLACVLIALRCWKLHESAWLAVQTINETLKRHAKGDA